MASGWNSVQIATLAVAALTPVTVAGLGYFVARASRRLEQVRWANQTVVTRRLEIFKEVGPLLNQLLCFATFVGGWKEIEPRDAIAVKRKIDEVMYSSRVLFSDSLFAAYQEFMLSMFATYVTTETDAHLRAAQHGVVGGLDDQPVQRRQSGQPRSDTGRLRTAGGAIPRRPLRHP